MTMPTREQLTQSEDESISGSVQSRSEDQAFGDVPVGHVVTGGLHDAGLLFQIGTVADNIPEWSIYPAARDRRLRQYYKNEPIAAGAVYSLSARVKSLDWQLTGQEDLHEEITALLTTADLGGGFRQLLGKTVIDLSTQDNGAFWELVGAGATDQQMIGPPTAVNYLDPLQCWRTFDPKYPVLYINPITGRYHRLHRSRVVRMSSMTQPNELGRGVGLSPISRALLAVQNMRSIMQYRYEKVSGRFERAIIFGSGLTNKTLQRLIAGVGTMDDNEGLTRIGRIPAYVTPQGVELDILDLASIPDNFDLVDETEMYVYTLALAFGVDPREFWAATQSGATKADASIQNMKARGKGLADLLTTIADALNRYVMPDGVEFSFDFVDEEADQRSADKNKVIVDTLSTIKTNGGLSPAQYQAMLINEGVLDEAVLAEASSIAIMDAPATSIAEGGNESTEAPFSGDDAPTMGNAAAMAGKSKDDYRKRLSEAVRGLFNKDLSFAQFVTSMDLSIRRHLRNAFEEGLNSEGIRLDEMTSQERARLTSFITGEMSHVMKFARDIIDARDEDGASVKPFLERVDGWASRYSRVKAKAKLMAAGNKKKRWVKNDLKDNCRDCKRLDGRVYRARVWDRWGIEPQSPLLACFGVRCGCKFEDVDSSVKVTPGRPPKLTRQRAKDFTDDELVAIADYHGVEYITRHMLESKADAFRYLNAMKGTQHATRI